MPRCRTVIRNVPPPGEAISSAMGAAPLMPRQRSARIDSGARGAPHAMSVAASNAQAAHRGLGKKALASAAILSCRLGSRGEDRGPLLPHNRFQAKALVLTASREAWPRALPLRYALRAATVLAWKELL